MINKNRKSLIFGVGVNDANYRIELKNIVDGKRKTVWKCPYYQRWVDMLQRCYSPKKKEKQSCYLECSVCEEWLTFSNFKDWMEKQKWYGLHLDKDLLIKGNKIYGPNTCRFVPAKINSFFSASYKNSKISDLPAGVRYEGSSYSAECSYTLTRSRKRLGRFTCPFEAHRAWQTKKFEDMYSLLTWYKSQESFLTDVADSILERAWGVMLDYGSKRITKNF